MEVRKNTADGEEEGIPIWNESGEVGGRVGNGNFEATHLRKVIAFDSGQDYSGLFLTSGFPNL